MQSCFNASIQLVKPFSYPYVDYSYSSETILTKQPILLTQNPTECYKGWNVHMERCMLRMICISWAYKLAGSVVRLAITAPPGKTS